jgi:5-formyltetrahydrofolate cyclo-ligase
MTERAQPPAVAPLRQHKEALRKEILSRRGGLDHAEHSRLSHAITARLLNLSEAVRARCVLAYLSFGSEFDTIPFVSALLSRGCALVLPRMDLARHSLTLYRVNDPDAETLSGVWGIREPDPQRCAVADVADIDAVLVPGVAFTANGWRLGYGGGFYDTLIRGWHHHPPLIGPAFQLQIVEELPLGPNDQPIDVVITEAHIYRRDAP